MEDKEKHASRQAISKSKMVKKVKKQFRCLRVLQEKSFEELNV